MAIHEEAAHVTDADVPDELDGGRSEVPLSIFTGSEAFKKKAPSNRPLRRTFNHCVGMFLFAILCAHTANQYRSIAIM